MLGHGPNESTHLHKHNHIHDHQAYAAVPKVEDGKAHDSEDAPRARRRSSLSMLKSPAPKWHATEELWPQPKQVRMGGANDMEYEHEKSMSWSELFFDLIFVVTIARLGEHAREPTTSGISFDDGTYAEYFTVFFMFWLQANSYGTRFSHNDAPNMLYFGTTMLGTIGMTMHISGGFDGDAFPKFALSAALTCAVDVWAYLRIWLTPDSNDGVQKGGRMFAKTQVFYTLLRLIPFLALGCDLIDYRRGIFEWCIFTFFVPFIPVLFLPCIIRRPSSPSPKDGAANTGSASIPMNELKEKIATLRQMTSEVEHLLTERLKNPSAFKYSLGRAPDLPDGSETPESKNDCEVIEALENIENFPTLITAWAKKHESKIKTSDAAVAAKDFVTDPDTCWNRRLCSLPVVPFGFVPIHLEHYTERLGLFIIIGLGEGVDDITSKDTENYCLGMYTVVASAFVILFGLKTLYFDSDSSHIDDHAMRRHRLSGIMYTWVHLPLMFSVAWLGSGLNLMSAVSRGCGEMHDGEVEVEEADEVAVANRRYYVCYSLALYLIVLELIFILHNHPDDAQHPLRKLKLWLQLGLAAVCCGVPSLVPEEIVSDASLLLCLSLAIAALVVFSFVEARWNYGD